VRERILPPDKAREMREKLQAQLQQIEQQDTLRYAAIGRAVEKEAESDPKLAAQLQDILARNVTDRGERMCLGLVNRQRGGRRSKATTGQLSSDQPDRGADMA
jgi:hypothetical protein